MWRSKPINSRTSPDRNSVSAVQCGLHLTGREAKLSVGRELTKDKSRLSLERESVSSLAGEGSTAKISKEALLSTKQDYSRERDLAHVEALIPR